MDTIVYKKLDLNKLRSSEELSKKLSQIKNDAASRNAYYSSGCAHQQANAIVDHCLSVLNSLISIYSELESIQPGYILGNEDKIRQEVNQQIESEYKACESQVLKIFSDLKMTNQKFSKYSEIKTEIQTKLDVLIESTKLKSKSLSDLEQTEEEYSILKENFVSSEEKVTNNKYKCFVIMPIGDKDKNPNEYKNNMAVFQKIIKPCVENSKYLIDCYHADDELVTKTGDISRHIFDSILSDEIAIVDLRRQNPNVIYEMCMRNVLGGRTILICSDLNQNFFHSTKYRAIKYSVDGQSNQEFYRRLQVVIKDIINNPSQSDNPVKDFLGNQEVKVDKLSEEEKWYRNQGGILYNAYIKLKQAELYISSKEDYKFSVYERDNYEGWLKSLGDAIKMYSTEDIFKKDIEIDKDFLELGNLILSLSDNRLRGNKEEFDSIAQNALDKLNMILQGLSNNLEKVGFYLVTLRQRKKDLLVALDRLVVKFDKIDDDLYVDQNHHDISRDCELLAREIFLLDSNAIFPLSKTQLDKCREISINLMSLFIKDGVADGGQSLDLFRNNFKQYTSDARILLSEL